MASNFSLYLFFFSGFCLFFVSYTLVVVGGSARRECIRNGRANIPVVCKYEYLSTTLVAKHVQMCDE